MLKLKRAALFFLLSLSFISAANAQEDFVITVGENKVFTECNYHDTLIQSSSFPELMSAGNTAYVHALANVPPPVWDPDRGRWICNPEYEERVGYALVGVNYTWNWKDYSGDGSEPVKVTMNFTYQMNFKSPEPVEGVGGAGFALIQLMPAGWPSFNPSPEPTTGYYEIMGTDESLGIYEGQKGGNASVSATTTIADLSSSLGPIGGFIQAGAGSRCGAPFASYGNVDITINSITVEFPTMNQAPVASFNYSPQNPQVNQEITFDASSSSDSDGTIAKYEWSFGDGATAQEVTATHAYTQAGNYTVILTVTDDKGLIDTTDVGLAVTAAPVETPLDKQASQKDVITVGEPINVANGNMFTTENDISIPSSLIPLEFSRTYNSQDDFQGSFGFGWRSNFDIILTEQPDASVIEVDETGVYTIYSKNTDGTYSASAGKYSVLTKNPDGSYQILRKHGQKLYFNSSGLLTRIEDRNANAITILRSSSGVIQEAADASGRKLLFTADSQGKITQVTDPKDRVFKYEYDANGNLIKTIDPLNNQTLFEYDASHNLICRSDANNHSLFFEYDANDRVHHSWQENNNNEVTLSFDPANKVTVSTDSLGNVTTYEYNDYGLVTKITDAQGNTQAFIWDSQLNKTSSTNQNGSTTAFTYDARGNLLTVTDALTNTTTFTYEPNFDFIASTTDALGNTTIYSYDAKGNLIQTKDALNNITNYTYSQGLLIQILDANNNLTLFDYDSYVNLVQITDTQNNKTLFTYDILGNKTQTTDAQGNVTNFTYDLLSHLTQITYPDNSKVTYTYDAVGNLISSTDQNNNTTTYAYDVVDRLTQTTDAQGNTTAYTYDTEGNRTAITDAAGNITQYFYDSLNRLIRTQDALNNQALYSYDPVGNLVSKTDPNGITINYTYDLLNRLLKKQYPDQTEETFTYDARGALLASANSSISYNFTYDSLSQLLSVIDSNNRTISYSYDAVGNKTRMTTPEGKAVNYSYDPLNRLTSILDTYNKTTTYSYDSLSRRTKVTLPNQTTASYSYDTLNNLLSLINKAKNEEVISSYAYTYDKAGNRLTKTEPSLKTSYAYDALYRLTQSTPVKLKNNGEEKEKKNQLETFTYDAVGNRLTSKKDNYSYNSLNQLLNTNNYGYEYDKNGNLIKKTELDDKDGKQKAYTFSYDYENRLIKVEIQKENRLKVVSFTYDPFGRRLSKTIQREEIQDEDDGDEVEDSPEERTLPKATYYVYDSEDIILEYNQKGKITARYTHGPGIDEPISIERNNKLYYYHYDGLGSVTELTNRNQKTIESYTYDAFGNLKRQGNKTKNTFTYTAREYDKETGLYYYRARYYDPKIGRFLTQDPIGMVDGPNLYTYVKNNPINFIDPLGMQTYSGGTRAEWRLFIQHPRVAIEAEKASREAEQATINKFGRQGHNDESDAYRHAYWSAEMTRRIGSEFAESFGTAHEQNRDQPINEREMDLYNNKIGRELASNPTNRNKSTNDLIDEALKKGILQVAPGKKPKLSRR